MINSMPTSNPTAPGAPAVAPAIRPLRILYADDMPELRSLIRDMLARQGHSVETVDGGDTALLRLKEANHDFDLIVTDHHMPGINGLELVRRTRQTPFSGKIVVFSSELSDEVHAQYRKFAVDSILPKPIFPATFHHTLEQLFAPVPSAATEPNPPSATPLAVHA